VRAVADSGPLHDLVLIGEIGMLPDFVSDVVVPKYMTSWSPVAITISDSSISAPPAWSRVEQAPVASDPALVRLDPGERAALNTLNNGLLDLPAALTRLIGTKPRVRQDLLDESLPRTVNAELPLRAR
jgi:hypothetical protein